MMRLITPTLLEKSSKQLSKETDWDLLDQMDEEDEGQVRPLMDPTGNPLASEPYQQQGLQQETLNYMGNLMAQAKAKGPVPPKDK